MAIWWDVFEEVRKTGGGPQFVANALDADLLAVQKAFAALAGAGLIQREVEAPAPGYNDVEAYSVPTAMQDARVARSQAGTHGVDLQTELRPASP